MSSISSRAAAGMRCPLSTGKAVLRLAAAGAMVWLLSSGGALAAPPPAPKALMMDWDSLLPDSERAHFSTNAPAAVHDYLGERGSAARQSGSAAVNRKLAEAVIKLPGFVVPVVINEKGVITEFFLVPYLGACIHVPPPPPNQLVYVKLTGGGVRMESFEDPYWITGRLHLARSGTKMATAAYTLDALRMEPYRYN